MAEAEHSPQTQGVIPLVTQTLFHQVHPLHLCVGDVPILCCPSVHTPSQTHKQISHNFPNNLASKFRAWANKIQEMATSSNFNSNVQSTSVKEEVLEDNGDAQLNH